MVWGFFIVIPGVLAQVASLAEMSSVQPIAGAQYHWTWHLAPPKHRRFITWIQGWITWFSWISLLCSVVNTCANITTALVGISYPDYAPQGWHTLLIMYAYLIVFGLMNMYLFWIIPWVEFLAGILHVVLWIVFTTVLLTLAPRHSSHFVFFEGSKVGGWQNDFVSFNLGIILITWGFVGFDAAAHISEETRKARFAIPRAMFWSICINSTLAFGFVLVLLYSFGDVSTNMFAAYPLAVICYIATASVAGASVMIAGPLTINISVVLGTIASTSRLTWAWARDGALPAYFSYVSPRHRIPVRSVWLPIFMVMLLSLLNLTNSYTAFGVIIALCTLGLYQSYIIAIACMLHARLTHRIDVAPWSLGRYGVPINAFAIVYSVYLGFWMVWPNYLPIDGAGMNYALPINAAVWLFALVFWFAWGRKNWAGLDARVIEKVVGDADKDTVD
ncbi:uncharacterized protein LTR77_009268 [Saxophila tyrrhenica]|uniref:Amino acid permease n=1 Tax=Saxophila tyrrhenica TaxID=1690608 RepID=A0AAV9P1H3_9PEZI|nr:hypothetical protein LTR77_009268 [Saxophila tyrrhenica]